MSDELGNIVTTIGAALITAMVALRIAPHRQRLKLKEQAEILSLVSECNLDSEAELRKRVDDDIRAYLHRPVRVADESAPQAEWQALVVGGVVAVAVLVVSGVWGGFYESDGEDFGIIEMIGGTLIAFWLIIGLVSWIYLKLHSRWSRHAKGAGSAAEGG